MKEMLSKDLEETTHGGSADLLSVTELRVQLGEKEQELDRAKEALQAMKADRKRLKVEKADLVNQMQQLYSTLESREEQLREFIRNYDQHRKESEDAVKTLAKEKDQLEREKWDLRRQAKEATEHAGILRSQLDLRENRIKELEAELTMAKQSLATLTKDVPKRHSLAMPTETVVNGSQEWAMQTELPLTAAIRQSQQTLYHSHPADRQAALRVSPCHSRQPSVISDASVADGDRSSTPSDMNSPRHRTHSLCNVRAARPPRPSLYPPLSQSMEDLEDQRRKKKKEKMTLGSLSRVFARGKQRKSMEPGLFDDSDSQSSVTQQSLSDGEDHLERLQQVELTRSVPISLWKAATVHAWLDIVMAMPMYTRACSDNVKSGKVLLGLTDEDLERGLGITNPLHRRKLRLAIEDYRQAEQTGQGLSKASELDHQWVCKVWLSEVGLPKYLQSFHTHLVDGRTLGSLTRRDLDKLLSVSDHQHQTSLLLAVQLLHMLNFNKQALQARRAQCEEQCVDPLVWTNQRIIKWIRDIDLKEFADSLLSSGVHGALMVLDPSFSANSLALALGIPSHRHMLLCHLHQELRALLTPASAPPTPLRSSQPQEEKQGTPTHSTPTHSTPTHSPAAMIRFSEERSSLRQTARKSPLRFKPRFPGRRDLSFHGSCGSLPRDEQRKAPRAKDSPLHNYSGIEITNV
ncbi:kazrin [Clupea harengus]|uniref:Kazrin n=1 Tax=Clupea harengus TaxID=7950 RepID=A0A6P8FKQ1_CLUHA|nr:kazrin [Clupea harengus]